jgi:hypothetical protein
MSRPVGVLGAFLSIVLALFFRQMTHKALREMLPAVNVSAMMAFVLFLSDVGQVFQYIGLTEATATFMLGLDLSKYSMLAVICILYLILGCFFDSVSMLVLTIPFVAPIIKGLGFDFIWFGVLYVVLAEIGLVTPPFGLNLLCSKRRTCARDPTIFAGAIPFLIPTCMLIVLIILFQTSFCGPIAYSVTPPPPSFLDSAASPQASSSRIAPNREEDGTCVTLQVPEVVGSSLLYASHEVRPHKLPLRPRMPRQARVAPAQWAMPQPGGRLLRREWARRCRPKTGGFSWAETQTTPSIIMALQSGAARPSAEHGAGFGYSASVTGWTSGRGASRDQVPDALEWQRVAVILSASIFQLPGCVASR